MSPPNYAISQLDRRAFIGGSDARIIMGDDETALLRLWGKNAAMLSPKTYRQT
jgi:hypothetical protein